LGRLGNYPILIGFLAVILLFQTATFGTYSYAQMDSGSKIPAWIKNNADWWERGLISDREFASGLGFMIKEGIIKVENIDVDPEGDIVIDENIRLPKWIQNNARWWADGAISDDDFKSGIQFMLKEDIISFKEKTKISIPEIDPEIFEKAYVTMVWNQLAMTWLLEIKNYEADILDENTDYLWDEYSSSNDMETMNLAVKYQEASKKADDDLVKAGKILKEVSKDTEAVKKLARDAGNHVLDLEKAAEKPLMKIDEVPKVKSLDDYKQAKKDAKYVELDAKRLTDELKTIIGTLPSDEPPLQTIPEELKIHKFLDKSFPSSGIISPTQGATIASSDGTLILDISEGSVLTQTTVSIEQKSSHELPIKFNNDNLSETAYLFKPEGLNFLKPVELVILLDEENYEGFYSDGSVSAPNFFISGDEDIEPIPMQVEIDVAGKNIVASGEINHFSIVYRDNEGWFKFSLAPNDVYSTPGIENAWEAQVFIEPSPWVSFFGFEELWYDTIDDVKFFGNGVVTDIPKEHDISSFQSTGTGVFVHEYYCTDFGIGRFYVQVQTTHTITISGDVPSAGETMVIHPKPQIFAWAHCPEPFKPTTTTGVPGGSIDIIDGFIFDDDLIGGFDMIDDLGIGIIDLDFDLDVDTTGEEHTRNW